MVVQPELKQAKDKFYTRFSLAVNKKFSHNKEVDFIECVAWGKQAELIVKYVGKGNQLSVQGYLQTSTYQDKSGSNRKSVSVLVEQIEFIGGKSTKEEDNFNPTAYDESFKGSNKTPHDFNKKQDKQEYEELNSSEFDISEEDMPF